MTERSENAVTEAVRAVVEAEHGGEVIPEHAVVKAESEETDDIEELEEISEDTEEGGQDGEGEGGEEHAEQPEPLSPPAHWSQDDQTAFSGLDRASQEIVLKREKDFESDYTAKMQAVAPLKKFVDDNKAYFDSLGASPEAVIDYLLGCDKVLRTGLPEQKAQALQTVAQQYGVQFPQASPQDAAPAQFYDGEGNPVDIAAMVNQAVQPLQQQLGQVTNAVGQYFTAQQAAQVKTAEADIEAFRMATDEQGNLKHPHFDRLRPQIDALAKFQSEQGQTPDLAQLYTGICATDPIASKDLVSAQVASLDAERKAKVQKKQAAAKATVTGSRTSSAKSSETFATPMDAARAAFAKLSGE